MAASCWAPSRASPPACASRSAQACAAPRRAIERTIVVPDVDAFPGHIACDSASRSEVVIPLMRGNTVLGVLDVDSPKLARFDEEDARGLEALAKIFIESTDLG